MSFRFDAGRSAGGRLRFEHLREEADPDPRAGDPRRAVLLDDATGATLADGAGWDWSEIAAQPDGALFFRLIARGSDALFRIAPDGEAFSDWGARGPERPLAELPAALATERARLRDDRHPGYRHISKDGTVRVDLQSTEWAASQWVHSPRVLDLTTGRAALDLWGDDWDSGVPAFLPGGRVQLGLRRYRRGGSALIELDLSGSTFRILHPAEQAPRPMHELAEALEAVIPPTAAAAPMIGASPFAAWRTALGLLAAALAAIAIVAFVAARLGP